MFIEGEPEIFYHHMYPDSGGSSVVRTTHNVVDHKIARQFQRLKRLQEKNVSPNRYQLIKNRIIDLLYSEANIRSLDDSGYSSDQRFLHLSAILQQANVFLPESEKFKIKSFDEMVTEYVTDLTDTYGSAQLATVRLYGNQYLQLRGEWKTNAANSRIVDQFDELIALTLLCPTDCGIITRNIKHLEGIKGNIGALKPLYEPAWGMVSTIHLLNSTSHRQSCYSRLSLT